MRGSHYKNRKSGKLKQYVRKNLMKCGVVKVHSGKMVPVDVFPTAMYNKLYGTSFKGFYHIVSVKGFPIGVNKGETKFTTFPNSDDEMTFSTLQIAVEYVYRCAVDHHLPKMITSRQLRVGDRVLCMNEAFSAFGLTGTVTKIINHKPVVLWDNGSTQYVYIDDVLIIEKDSPLKGQVVSKFHKGRKVVGVMETPALVGEMIQQAGKGHVYVQFPNDIQSYVYSIGADNVYDLMYV